MVGKSKVKTPDAQGEGILTRAAACSGSVTGGACQPGLPGRRRCVLQLSSPSPTASDRVIWPYSSQGCLARRPRPSPGAAAVALWGAAVVALWGIDEGAACCCV